jgi:hypothetical protein
MNCNTDPLQVKVLGSYLGVDKDYENGTLVSVRALMNQALQFSVLLESGALYTGIPINMICSPEDDCLLDLAEAQMYDNIGDKIQVITFDLLRYMKCTVKTDYDNVIEGKYLFTIDFVGGGLSRHPVQWKQFHCVSTSKGWMVYPQYRLKFTDEALCPDFKEITKYKFNEKIHLSEY